VFALSQALGRARNDVCANRIDQFAQQFNPLSRAQVHDSQRRLLVAKLKLDRITTLANDQSNHITAPVSVNPASAMPMPEMIA